MGISGTLFAQNISKIMMGGKTYRYLAILFPLLILSIPHLTFAAVCNRVDGVVYGYGYDTGGEIKDYGVLGSGCGAVGPGDDICDALGSGGGGCTAVAIGPGSPYEITIGVQNQGTTPDRYRISWITPTGWEIAPLENESLTSSINVPEDLSGNPPAVGYCVDNLNPQVTYPCYNPGESPFFTFKVTPPSDFAGPQELVFDVMSLEDNSRVDSVKAVISSRDVISPAPVVLRTGGITERSVRVEWIAPDVTTAFFDDFTDGTLSPWSLLQNGVVEVVDSGEVIDGQSNYVLRKTTNGDPNGGWAPLSQTVGDFELILYTKRLSITCCNADRYSITDASGNGYGLYLDFNNGNLYMERRDAWVSTLVGTESALSGGLILNQWYTLRFTRTGQTLTAQAYVGRVGPATATPAATVSASDSAWVSFSQVNVNGGYDYDTDDVQVKALGGPATEYILKYSTKYIVDDGVTPGVGEVTFSDAIQVAPSPTPESPGVRECHIVPVKNIIDTSGILPPGACNLDPSQVGCDDRTRNTRFYFAIKALDEVRNKSPLSNVAGGLTPLLPFAYNMVSVPYAPNPNTPEDVFGDDVGTPLYVYWWDSRGPNFDTGCYDGEPGPYSVDPTKYACVDLASIKEAIGYFLWVPPGNIVLDVPATSTQSPATNCVDEGYGQDTWCITLGSAFRYYVFPLQEGWNKIGPPFDKEINFTPRDLNGNGSIEMVERGLYVRRRSGSGVEVATFQDAVTARNWIDSSIFTYNGVNYTYEICERDRRGELQGTRCKLVMQPWKAYWIKLHVIGGATFELLLPQ